METAYAAAALEEFQQEHKDDLPAGALLGVRLLPEGETPTNPLEYDAATAAAEYAAHRRRLGLTDDD